MENYTRENNSMEIPIINQNTNMNFPSIYNVQHLPTQQQAGVGITNQNTNKSTTRETNIGMNMGEAIYTLDNTYSIGYPINNNNNNRTTRIIAKQQQAINQYSSHNNLSNNIKNNRIQEKLINEQHNETQEESNEETEAAIKTEEEQQHAKKKKKDRKWKMTKKNDKVIANTIKTNDLKIVVRTRSDPENAYIAPKLYSSLKYELKVTLSNKEAIFKEPLNGILMMSVDVVDPDEPHQILKTPDGEDMIDGKLDYNTMNEKNGELTVKLKIQFMSVSFHHIKRMMKMKMTFYDSTEIDEPLFEMISAPFEILARRQRNASKNNEHGGSPRKKKRTNIMDRYEALLTQLVKLRNNMSINEGRMADMMIQRRFANSLMNIPQNQIPLMLHPTTVQPSMFPLETSQIPMMTPFLRNNTSLLQQQQVQAQQQQQQNTMINNFPSSFM